MHTEEITYTVTFENGEEYTAALEVHPWDSEDDIADAIEADVAERIGSHPEDRLVDFGRIVDMQWE